MPRNTAKYQTISNDRRNGNMKKRLIFTTLIILTSLALFSCNRQIGDNETGVSLNDAKKIKKGMTMDEVDRILGDNYGSTYSIDYPFDHTWNLEGGGELTVIFEAKGCKDRDDFYKKRSELGFPVQSTDTGGEDYLKVLKKWQYENTAVTAVYYKSPKETGLTYLIGSEP